jgi:hypothetical protein
MTTDPADPVLQIEPVHGSDPVRFARHADGRVE